MLILPLNFLDPTEIVDILNQTITSIVSQFIYDQMHINTSMFRYIFRVIFIKKVSLLSLFARINLWKKHKSN
jgi:hypothetical protein